MQELFEKDPTLLNKYKVKSFKIIKDPKGRKKLIAYFESLQTKRYALDNPFTYEDAEWKWVQDFKPSKFSKNKDSMKFRSPGGKEGKKNRNNKDQSEFSRKNKNGK